MDRIRKLEVTRTHDHANEYAGKVDSKSVRHPGTHPEDSGLRQGRAYPVSGTNLAARERDTGALMERRALLCRNVITEVKV
jgi:hypothetical protein